MSHSASTSPARSHWRRWFKRIFWIGLCLLILLIAGHQPLLRALLRWGGPQAAAALGVPLQWQVDGTLWNDFRFTHIATGGGTDHWLPKATIAELSADYDWHALLRQDYEHALRRIRLQDVDVELDLSKLPKGEPSPASPEESPAADPKPPPMLWPHALDLKNLNIDLTLADGSRLRLRGFTLQAGEGQPGRLECREFHHAASNFHLENLKADVRWEPLQLTFSDLALPGSVVLSRLTADLRGLSAQADADTPIHAELDLRLGEAQFKLKATLTGLFKAPLWVKAEFSGERFHSSVLHSYGLPQHVLFEEAHFSLNAEGDPTKPREFQSNVQFQATQLRAQDAQVDRVTLNAHLKQGRAEVTQLEIQRADNRLNLTAQANLPEDLKDWATTAWTAELKAQLPTATAFLQEAPPFSGHLQLNATAEGKGPTPTRASGELKGTTLAFDVHKLPQLRGLFSLDGQQARLAIPSLELGAGNTLELNAALQMRDVMPVEASWKIHITDPKTLLSAIGQPPLQQPLTARVSTQGNARFNVQELSAQDYQKVLADLVLQVDQIAYGDGQLQKGDLHLHVEDGQVQLKPAHLHLDDQNAIELTGQMELKPPFAFKTEGTIQLPQLTALNLWLQAFGAPAIQSGAATSKLNLKGQWQPWQSQGDVHLSVRAAQTSSMPQAVDLDLETVLDGKRAELQKLEARLGPWRLSVKGSVDEQQAQLTELQAWQNQTRLLHGSFSAPFDWAKNDAAAAKPLQLEIEAKDLKIHEILADVGLRDLPSAVLNADIRISGQPQTAQAKIIVEFKDIQIPQAPKSFQRAVFRSETTLENQRIKTLSTLTQPPLQTLTIEGSLPLDVPATLKDPQTLQETPLQISVRLPKTDLSFLREYAPTLIRSLPAQLKLDADIAGTVTDPKIQGELSLDIDEITWSRPDLPSVRQVRTRIRASDKRINIEDLSALLAGGRVKLGGHVDLKAMANPGLDLRIEAREALVFRDPSTSLRANADIACRGTLQKAAVTGTVEAVRGRVFKEIDLMPVLKLPADVPSVPPDTSRSEARLSLPPQLQDWTFDIRVRTRDPLLISGNLANGAVSADVHLGGSGANPQLTGGANVDRLLLKLPFSMVKITKGVITLRPQSPFDPEIDIRGESRIGSNDLTLYIYGASTQPKTRFTSTPPLSEPDIVTLLATGTTLNGSPNELASEAATRAAFLFISEFYRKTFNKKKVVREEPPRLNMTFNPSGADRSNDSVQATYDLTDKWRLTGRFTQTGRMKALLGYVLRFGKAAQAVDAPTISSPEPPAPAASSPAP